jgi:hypothetical protein
MDKNMFYINPVVAKEESAMSCDDRCFCCNDSLTEAIHGPVIAYDAFPTSDRSLRMLMHRDCAFAMAQRIIFDAWPNRRVGELMKNNR